jgi:hypothetical protein
VTDPQGSVIQGAIVFATQTSTGAQRRTVTTDEGLYVLPGLEAGEYEVRVQAGGFAEKRYGGVVLLVGQNVTLDSTLDVVTVQESVLVSGDEVPLVNTTTSVVDGVVTPREIEGLPLNGRNFLELAFLIPGNAPAPIFDPTKVDRIAISSAGQLGRGGNIMIDGGDNNDDVVGGPLQNISQDAIQEFQIATNRFSAEYGRSASSVVNVVTKSGTNELHGSAAFFFRNRHLQGLPATFDRRLEEPPFDREQYSVTAGGPVVKDALFWFGSFEYRNQDDAVLVGSRDFATRSIQRGLAEAPLDNLLATVRGDWNPSESDSVDVRYSFEKADFTGRSTLIREIGSETQREESRNRYHSALARWTHTLTPTAVNSLSFSWSDFDNRIDPVVRAPQLTFPSLQDGTSFRIPQGTRQTRLQLADTVSLALGQHSLRLGGEVHWIDADFDLEVFQQGRIELLEDFPAFDRNGDGQTNDDDLLFAVTLRSAFPDRPLLIHDADNTYVGLYVQDDWRVHPRFTLNLGLRYELDTDVKNVSRVDELNPLILPFTKGGRERDKNNFGPRVGFNWDVTGEGRTSIRGGYGIYYDRVTLQIQSLERGLDGRALPVEVRAGNVFFMDPETGMFPPIAPTLSNPFTGFILPGAGASGINIIDDDLQNPSIQQFNIGIEHQFGDDFVAQVEYLRNLGTHFIIGRTIGTVFNPVVGGPDRVVNLESSVNTIYDGLLVSVEKRYSDRYQLRASYTLSKAFNYANDDQIPFSNGPADPSNLRLDYGPTPNDQRHRFVLAGQGELPGSVLLSVLWTASSGVPMDIVLPDGSRVPGLQRNAGGRLFDTGAELNAYLTTLNAGGASLPLVRDDAQFSDGFNSVDVRLSRPFRLGETARLEPIVEIFNLFNVTNVLGVSNVNYSGFSNVLVPDSDNPATSSSFGQPITTAGGVFGSGGPRAFQLAARFIF